MQEIPRRTRTRRVASGFIVAGITSSLLLGAAPAEADTSVYTFVPIRLTVFDTEDGWLDSKDEPRMYYHTAVWADVVQRGGYEGEIPPVDFPGSEMRVDLWERDGGWVDSDFLGGETVTSQILDEERTITFQGDWWHYELRYKVVEKK
jgi:hypothetical protein